jgi:hypothetical protein
VPIKSSAGSSRRLHFDEHDRFLDDARKRFGGQSAITATVRRRRFALNAGLVLPGEKPCGS